MSDDKPIGEVIAELRAALDAATNGPWRAFPSEMDSLTHIPIGPEIGFPNGGRLGDLTDADAELIVKAHNYLGRLLDVVQFYLDTDKDIDRERHIAVAENEELKAQLDEATKAYVEEVDLVEKLATRNAELRERVEIGYHWHNCAECRRYVNDHRLVVES